MGATASNQNEKDFNFDKENLMNMGTQMHEKPKKPESDNVMNAAKLGKFNNENVMNREEQEKVYGAEQYKLVVDKDDGAIQKSKTKKWRKWSTDKLNNAINGLVLESGGVHTTKMDILQQTKNVDCFDHDIADDKEVHRAIGIWW
ncbi:hypothetical protein L7F22_037383 [Adiantum nelumboides]|nr:hypothetical protein [Adiantum nelumboides]